MHVGLIVAFYDPREVDRTSGTTNTHHIGG